MCPERHTDGGQLSERLTRIRRTRTRVKSAKPDLGVLGPGMGERTEAVEWPRDTDETVHWHGRSGVSPIIPQVSFGLALIVAGALLPSFVTIPAEWALYSLVPVGFAIALGWYLERSNVAYAVTEGSAYAKTGMFDTDVTRVRLVDVREVTSSRSPTQELLRRGDVFFQTDPAMTGLVFEDVFEPTRVRETVLERLDAIESDAAGDDEASITEAERPSTSPRVPETDEDAGDTDFDVEERVSGRDQDTGIGHDSGSDISDSANGRPAGTVQAYVVDTSGDVALLRAFDTDLGEVERGQSLSIAVRPASADTRDERRPEDEDSDRFVWSH